MDRGFITFSCRRVLLYRMPHALHSLMDHHTVSQSAERAHLQPPRGETKGERKRAADVRLAAERA